MFNFDQRSSMQPWLHDWTRFTLKWKGDFDIDKAAVMVFRVGSHSHGTYVPPDDPNGVDDVDMMVVVIPPEKYKLGLVEFEHATYQRDTLDIVVYDWSKWLRMLLKQNPNVVGTLWLEPEDMFPRGLYRTQPFMILRELYANRDRLVSMEMAKSFGGYARGQLYKMTHHAHQGYMGAKRKALVEQYGYDVKNAAHLIRLLRMAIEALTTGKLTVRRPDARELIDIKQGKWSLAQVEDEAERLFHLMGQAEVAKNLPDKPDESFIEDIMIRGYRQWWA